MSIAERLKRHRREEQEQHGYANSSRWYTGLSNVISFLDHAENETDAVNRFRDAWTAADTLSQMYVERGEEEFKGFDRWVTSIKDHPLIQYYFAGKADDFPLDAYRAAVNRAKNSLLEPPRHHELLAWSKPTVSPQKASRYFFNIGRDIRNRLFHGDVSLASPVIKKVLGLAAECLIPIVATAAQIVIERPVEGTIGRATAYRFFLYPFLKNSDGFFSDYYLERLFPDEELGTFPEDQTSEALKSIAKQFEAREAGLKQSDGEETLKDWCNPALFKVLEMKPDPGVRIISEDAVFEPTLVLPREGSAALKKEYRGKEAAKDIAAFLWILPWRASLDAVSTDPAFESVPVTEVVHGALARSDVPWAIVTNGHELRLLGKTSAHRPRCFLEANLSGIVDRRVDKEAVLAFRFLLGLFSGPSLTEIDEGGKTRLERVAIGSERHGKEIGDELKQNVYDALEELGEGFLDYLRSHRADLDYWRERKTTNLSRERFLASDELLEDIYHESLSLMYRLLFLFYAESRELLPVYDSTYQESYSLEALRDYIGLVNDNLDDSRRFFGRGGFDLWNRLKELFALVNGGWSKVPAFNGGLFDPEKHEFLERFAVGDYYLARAIDLLSRTRPRGGQNRGEGRKKVTYRDLDVRHLGSIYEGILEYSAHIADQDYVIMKSGSGRDTAEDYVALAELTREQKQQLTAWREAVEENPGNPRLSRGCKVTGHKEKGQYYLVYGGRESKRKSSGSYYTPDYIVQYIVENTLGPLVRGDCRLQPEALSEEIERELKKIGATKGGRRTGPLTSDEILELKVLDPAMGSGHFLVAATEFLARAYQERCIGEGKTPREAAAEQEFIRAKRMIAERCIYGVDSNPMAVELAKLSTWLFTMDPGRPLSFLDHHLKCGNTLMGAWIKDLGQLPEFDRSGKPKLAEDTGQGNLFEQEFRKRLPLMLKGIFGIMKKETVTPKDIETKKLLDQELEKLKQPFRMAASVWTASLFGEDASDYFAVLSNSELARERESTAARDYSFFHYEIEFPEIWFTANGDSRADSGFTAVIGNPPYDVVAGKEVGRDLSREIAYFRFMPIFAAAIRGKTNLYKLFISAALNLLSRSGRFSFIVPMALLGDDQALGVRTAILSSRPVGFEVFPQKDDPERRVFREAKLSTTIFLVSPSSPSTSFWVRTHKGRDIEDASPMLKLKRTELELLDSTNLPIPTCTQRDMDITLAILRRPIARLGDLAKSKQGEVNETVHRGFLRPSGRDPILRGASITMYCVRSASQGEDLYIDAQGFLAASEPDGKQRDSQFERVGFQRSAPQNNFRRLIAAVIPKGRFCFDTVSYVTSKDTDLDLRFVTAYLNSEIADWYFRITSSNSKVNEYQFNSLPLPKPAPPSNIRWEPLFDSEDWDGLREALTGACDTPGTLPADVISALGACSGKISRFEKSRALTRRSDRAKLGTEAAAIQTIVDAVFFKAFGLTDAEAAYVRQRRTEML
jgi:hypothetical protein